MFVDGPVWDQFRVYRYTGQLITGNQEVEWLWMLDGAEDRIGTTAD